MCCGRLSALCLKLQETEQKSRLPKGGPSLQGTEKGSLNGFPEESILK